MTTNLQEIVSEFKNKILSSLSSLSSLPSNIDYEYIGGFFDGEGSIYIWRDNKNSFKLQCAMSQNDSYATRYFMLCIYNWFGGSVTSRIAKVGRKRKFWTWCVSCNDAKLFLEKILPYLKFKYLQAKIAMEWQKNRPATFSYKGRYTSNADTNHNTEVVKLLSLIKDNPDADLKKYDDILARYRITKN